MHTKKHKDAGHHTTENNEPAAVLRLTHFLCFSIWIKLKHCTSTLAFSCSCTQGCNAFNFLILYKACKVRIPRLTPASTNHRLWTAFINPVHPSWPEWWWLQTRQTTHDNVTEVAFFLQSFQDGVEKKISRKEEGNEREKKEKKRKKKHKRRCIVLTTTSKHSSPILSSVLHNCSC